MRNANLIAHKGNQALVHLEGRRYPGLTIQGDSLKVLSELVDELRSSIESARSDEIGSAMDELGDSIHGLVSGYEEMMRSAGLSLPY